MGGTQGSLNGSSCFSFEGETTRETPLCIFAVAVRSTTVYANNWGVFAADGPLAASAAARASPLLIWKQSLTTICRRSFSTRVDSRFHFMAAVVRAFAGYFFLVFIVRIVGRRPGKQMTPFEFVLIFFIGGLALTAMVGDEVSFTNAICQIITIGFAHYTLAWARSKSHRMARLVDGTPLILLEHKAWRTHTLRHMRITDNDVMASARDSGLKTLEQVDRAVLERNGEISISPMQATPRKA